MRFPGWMIPAAIFLTGSLSGGKDLTFEQRAELIRGLNAEYATAKTLLPRSKKALEIDSRGLYDKQHWQEVAREFGPAARVGDLLQITKVSIEGDRIEFEINGGWKGGRKWYDRIQIGVGSRTAPISSGGGGYSMAPSGTKIALLFNKKLPPLKSGDVKEILAPILDFNMRSATEQYVESLPPEIRTAVEEKKAIEGMDRDMVLLAMGHPVRKIRETKDGEEYEDWVYGTPPGRIVFVTFHDNKVIRVREAYAGLGGEVAPPLETPR